MNNFYVKDVYMTSSSKDIRRKGYHHGNLREALVLAAKQLIMQKGPHGFTLVEAAKLAGVSPGAPYRHFKDQNSLLSEVALRGFELFNSKLEKAWAEAEPNWKTAFMRMGAAYIEFANEEKAFYRAMFDANHSIHENEQLKRAGDQAYDRLFGVAEHIKKYSKLDEDISAEEITFHISSMSRGAAAMLKREGYQGSKIDPVELLTRNMEIYLRGLGI